MRRLDAGDAYRLANMFFPDDGTLALYNLVIEVMNGDLPYEVIDGSPDVVEAPDTDLAIALGMATVGEHPCMIKWVFDHDHDDKQGVMLRLVRALAVTEQPKALLDLQRPPFTLAALVACEGSDGRFTYALFRHPELDETQARLILISTFPPEKDEEPAPTAKN